MTNPMNRSAFSRLALSAALLAVAAPLAAQNQTAPSQPDVVGPPALENFDLGGDRIVAAPPPPPPAETQPVTVVPPPPSPAATARRPAESRETTPRPPEQAPAVPRESTADAPETVDIAPDDAGSPAPELSATPPPPVPSAQSPEGSTTPVETAAQEEDGGIPWWAAIAGGILLLGSGAYFGRRRASTIAAAEPEDVSPPISRPAPGPVPKGMPVAASPAAAPAAAVPRASVELVFEPTSTVLGDKEAIVHFLLTVHNSGELPAKNVRLEARVFNAGMSVDTDIGAFFAAPLQRRVVTLPQALPTGERLGIQGEVPITVADIRPIEVEGRKLFIPIVAVTAIYEWEGGSGQTSKSYMVGVEAGQTGKMGPFRLDQGPRVYRSVGQRAHRLVKTA